MPIIPGQPIGQTPLLTPISNGAVPLSATPSAWFAANWGLAAVLPLVPFRTVVTGMRFHIGTSSGNMQASLLKVAPDLSYTRVATTGVIATPAAANEVVVSFTANTLIEPGCYAAALWFDNATVTTMHWITNTLNPTRITLAPPGTFGTGWPTSGSVASTGRALAGLSVTCTTVP